MRALLAMVLLAGGLQGALIEPDSPPLKMYLQLWLRADKLDLKDGAAVHVWPDVSGHGHDLTATAGIRPQGVGTAPKFVVNSEVRGQPAVRFESGNGLAGSPDHPLDIKGNAALTIILVARYRPHKSQLPYDNLFFIGDPAGQGGGNPGRPTAALIELDRSKANEPSLDFAGGFSHDAKLGKGSVKLLYAGPLILTFVKVPGPMTNVRVFYNGKPEEKLLGHRARGTQALLDLKHRNDVGVSIGRASSWGGSVNGDVAEVIVFNKALSDTERETLERTIARRYNLWQEKEIAAATRRFTPKQKSHWAFQPVKRLALPNVKNTTWVKSPIDRFILAQIEKAGGKPAPPATRHALLRRVTFDLIGLPPTPEEMDAFIDDPAPDDDAFTRVVNRLLGSPHYGERWGRLWMDVVRYADTTANDGNFIMRQAWRYRDWIVRALNEDLPYDQFIIQQFAGDLIPDKNPRITLQRAIATGFLMVGPKALAEADKEQTRMDIVDEQLDVMGRAFLGLTVSCARCHDHKFDPIPMVDYYSLAGILRSTEVFGSLNKTASKWMEYELPTGEGNAKVRVMAPRDGSVIDLRVHKRGSRHNLGGIAPRRFLQVIAGEGHAPLRTGGSGRLELARWIASADNPLTARVMVNRLWQGHFGRGLVETSDNFGMEGAKPSDPALLDWLAAEFVAGGWSLKTMHRAMLLSNTYRQAADQDSTMPRRRLEAEQFRDAIITASGQLDGRIGGNEIIEKAFNAGENIDKKRNVVSASTINSRWEGFDSNRRSLYLPVIRNGQPDILALFDVADANQVVTTRGETTVASQAAYLLNNPFVQKQAVHLASLLQNSAKNDPGRVQLLWKRCLGRLPSKEEEQGALAFLSGAHEDKQAAWKTLCQGVFCFNEFIYLE